MKTILVPFTHAECGGSQLSFLKLARLLKNEFDFHLWLFEDGPFAELIRKEGFKLDIYPFSYLRSPLGLMKVKKLLKQLKPDHIYLHSSRLIARMAKQIGIPCSEKINMSRVDEAGGWVKYSAIDKYFSNQNSRLLVVSEALKKQMIERGIDEQKIDFIYSFIEEGRFNRQHHRKETRQELNLRDSHIVLCNIGRMVTQKAQSDFIRVVRNCHEKEPRIRALLVGQGPLKNELLALVSEAELNDRVQILDPRQDIEKIYAASDIFIHTAHWEPLANVLLEARATGLAIVASDVDGSEEALRDYPYHDLVETGNIEAFTEAVLKWTHAVPALKAPALPHKFTEAGAKERFINLFNNDKVKA